MSQDTYRLNVDLFVEAADAAPVMLWMSDAENRCTFVNRSWLDFTGRTFEQALGHGWTEGIHFDDRDGVLDAVRSAFTVRQPFATEYRMRSADGQYRWLLDRGAPLLDSDGRFAGYIGSCTDITDRKQMECALASEQQGRALAEQRVAESDSRLHASEARLQDLAARLHAAREDERASVARELHDEIGQNLTGLKLDLTRAFDGFREAGMPLQLVDRVQSLMGAVEIAIQSVRRIATELRPAALDHFGLAAAIELEAATVQRRTGLRCRVLPERQPNRLDPRQTTAVFRIVQEALTNIVRHAGACAVRIRMRQTVHAFTLDVIDNGRGISDQQLADPGSIGILGMRERARRLGGTLKITRNGSRGTTVAVEMPTDAPAARPRIRR